MDGFREYSGGKADHLDIAEQERENQEWLLVSGLRMLCWGANLGGKDDISFGYLTWADFKP